VSASKEPSKIDRHALVTQLQKISDTESEWIRRQVLQNDRIDILAREVLGYEVQPFHFAMMRWQFLHPQNLQLAFRGAGKTTACTVAKCIHYILKNRNIRILIASKTSGHAVSCLHEIKTQLEDNQRLKEVFGDLVDKDKWNEEAIEVAGRTIAAKEPTVMTLGIGGQAIGKHFDVVIADDLVDEDNSRTEYMRQRIKNWFYKVLYPTLEPGAHLHVLGTRYHFNDLYGHLQENEMDGHCQIIPALNEAGQSPWPDRYPATHFVELRKRMGLIIFNSQYQCDTEAMKGEMFQYDWMREVGPEEVPEDAVVAIGVDLAIKEKETADCFALVAIAATKDGRIYVIDHYSGHLSFSKQTAKILEWWRTGVHGWTARENIIWVAIETNQYQEAQAQVLRETEAEMPIKQIHTIKDKVTRGWKLAAKFEEGRVFIVKGQPDMIEHLVLFPSGRFKDLFDALDHAVSAAFGKRARRNRDEPGLL
jgi:predicted phage terminase large subunit-like protein